MKTSPRLLTLAIVRRSCFSGPGPLCIPVKSGQPVGLSWGAVQRQPIVKQVRAWCSCSRVHQPIGLSHASPYSSRFIHVFPRSNLCRNIFMFYLCRFPHIDAINYLNIELTIDPEIDDTSNTIKVLSRESSQQPPSTWPRATLLCPTTALRSR